RIENTIQQLSGANTGDTNRQIPTLIPSVSRRRPNSSRTRVRGVVQGRLQSIDQGASGLACSAPSQGCLRHYQGQEGGGGTGSVSPQCSMIGRKPCPNAITPDR